MSQMLSKLSTDIMYKIFDSLSIIDVANFEQSINKSERKVCQNFLLDHGYKTAKKINESRIVYILHLFPNEKPICLTCFKRIATIYIAHYDPSDYSNLEPKIVSNKETCYFSEWCVECLLRCKNLDTTTKTFIFNNIKCPTKEELDELTKKEECERIRDIEEEKCCCKKHIRVCHPKASDDFLDFEPTSVDMINFKQLSQKEKNDTLQFIMYYRDCELYDYYINFLQQKLDEYLEIDPNNKDEIGKWLLWVGDDEIRNKNMFYIVYDNNQINLIQKGKLLRRITQAYVFIVKTRCYHNLPKPYEGCSCNFSEKHYRRIIEYIEYTEKTEEEKN